MFSEQKSVVIQAYSVEIIGSKIQRALHNGNITGVAILRGNSWSGDRRTFPLRFPLFPSPLPFLPPFPPPKPASGSVSSPSEVWGGAFSAYFQRRITMVGVTRCGITQACRPSIVGPASNTRSYEIIMSCPT